jgi:hypothetical protein
VCLLAPGHLLGRISDEDLILLSASPDAGARTVEGSGVRGEEDESDVGEMAGSNEPSRAVRARASRTDGQTWTSSACWEWIFGKVPGQDVVDRLQDYKIRTKMALWSLCKLKDRSHMPVNIRTHANGLSLYKNCQFQTCPPPSVASHLRAALRSLTITYYTISI